MKKIITSFVFISAMLLNSIVFSQTTHPFELGLNAGASWLKSDVKMKKLGGAGGFTFGQMYAQNEKNALDWGWRFRYLNALAYGQDSKRSTGIANNPLLNGMYDTAHNYNSNGGYVYQNYKTHLDECSLELIIGLNKMRNTTHFYPYIFGGLGITKAVTLTNQLNGMDVRYNYFNVDSTGSTSSSNITSHLNNLYDGTYETTAEGSEKPRWKFMPSLGLGLGFEVVKGFSIGLEHKVTWALSDGLDGQQWSNDNNRSTSNDMYHYSSVWLKISFGRAPKSPATTTTTTVTDQNTLTTPAGDRPSVVITNPNYSPFTSSQKNYIVKATVTNVNSKSDIGFVYNGISNSNFSYDATSHVFSFPVLLVDGSNTFLITATNTVGNNSASATVVFNEPIVVPPSAPAPVVTITSPSSNPFTTPMFTTTVNANVLNVTSASQVSISVNGIATNSFTFNAASHGLSITSNLIAGANTFVISASNSSGSDSKSITVIYNKPVVSPPPVITIVSPASNPYTITSSPIGIAAIVQNVTAIGQVSVTINNAPVPTSHLSFDATSGQLNFNTNLIQGANTIVVSATNVAGADSKTETVIYSQQVAVAQPPVVTITMPTVNPFNTTNSIVSVNVLVMNVASASEIAVSVNGSPTGAFAYNVGTKQLAMTVSLIPGANLVTISASNSAGNDSKSETIIYSQPAALPAPVVTITLPTTNPFNTTTNTAVVNALVMNVLNSSQINVSVNGSPTSAFTYNVGTKQFAMIVNLIAGANLVTISASNSAGSDSKSETIIYSQQAALPAPVVTITLPTTNPFNTTTNTSVVNALVMNVVNSSQIAVSINGSPTSAFTYNLGTKQLAMTVNLISGANLVTISANNGSGSDSKSETIIYTVPVAVPAPVVTITVPNVNPYNTTVNTAVVNASVLNVASSSQITVSLNGIPTSAFSYNISTKQLVFTASLVAGANLVTISANNGSGSDSKSETIIYSLPVVIPPPVVTITTPSTPVYTTNLDIYNVVGSVLNVAASSDITVKINGVVFTSFSYSLVTKKITFNITMPGGPKTIVISAVNAGGSDSKTATVNFVRQIDPLHPDTITSPTNPNHIGTGVHHGGGTGPGTGGSVVLPAIVFGSANPLTTTDAILNVSAAITGIATKLDVVVKVNNVIFSFDFVVKTKTVNLPVNLNMGVNTVTILATNAGGTKTETLTITRN